MTTLTELLERVEKATGPDHPLGHEVLLALGARHDHDWDHEYWFGEVRLLPYDITASIDAAVALVEKKLPDHEWGVHCHKGGFLAHVTKRSPIRPMPNAARMPTPALALIAALLKALIAQGDK